MTYDALTLCYKLISFFTLIFQWNIPMFRPTEIKNPLTDRHETWQGWLCRGYHPTCTFWYIYPYGGRFCICVKLSSSVSIFYTPLLFDSLRTCRDRTVWPIFVLYGSKDVFPRQLRPFWGTDKKINNVHYFRQKTRNSLFPQCKTSVGNNSGSIKDQCKKNFPVYNTV